MHYQLGSHIAVDEGIIGFIALNFVTSLKSSLGSMQAAAITRYQHGTSLEYSFLTAAVVVGIK